MYSEGVGLVVLKPADKSLQPVLLSRVLYVPALQNNLLSVLHLVANHGFRIEIEGKEMVFLQSGEHRFALTRRACAGSGAAGDGVRTSADEINTTTHLEWQATV
jgi:hypothetical protein